MGGSAFASAVANGLPTLHTPRMTPAEYQHLKGIYQSRLTDYFTHAQVDHLREVPEKDDFGDLDFVVASSQPIDFAHLAAHLGAAAYIPSKTQVMLAVHQDGSRHSEPPSRCTVSSSQSKHQTPPPPNTDAVFAQVDVRCIDPALFAWHLFHHSYGGLAMLLGQLLHNLGLSLSDHGLVLRLQELEDARASADDYRLSVQQGRLCLSRDPAQVMRFLGLNAEKYDDGFESVDDFFDWLAACRMLTPDYVQREQYRRRDSASQRREEAKRPLITRFLTGYLPRRFGSSVVTTETDEVDLESSRRRWRDDAVAWFSKQSEFQTQLNDLVNTIQNQKAERLLRPIIHEHCPGSRHRQAEVLRSLRRWLGFVDGQPLIRTRAQVDDESQLRFWLGGDGLRDRASVDAFIARVWERCTMLERTASRNANIH